LTAAGIPDRVDTGLGTLKEISNKTIEYKWREKRYCYIWA
jgi:hypothetical protein